MSGFILRCPSGSYYGENETYNSVRSFAKVFASIQEAKEAVYKLPNAWEISRSNCDVWTPIRRY